MNSGNHKTATPRSVFERETSIIGSFASKEDFISEWPRFTLNKLHVSRLNRDEKLQKLLLAKLLMGLC